MARRSQNQNVRVKTRPDRLGSFCRPWRVGRLRNGFETGGLKLSTRGFGCSQLVTPPLTKVSSQGCCIQSFGFLLVF